jgi:hypothetical protein
MSINELNSSVGSWSRFVKLKEAARERNSGLGANGSAAESGASGASKFSEILSSKSGDNVYSKGTVEAYRDNVSAAAGLSELKALGRMFDSYA